MTQDYLDISKSVMISSPAGSGKTEKLARRYISLLKGGSEVERILAITFTDKAAAEMKERILNILRDEDRELFERIKEKVPRMRISTIHSFCLKLLKRFSIDLGIDPSLEVIDSFTASVLWSEAIYESLLECNVNEKEAFIKVLKASGIKGWSKLFNIFNELHALRPGIELILKDGIYEGTDESSRFKDVLSLYSRCLERYRKKKRERHLIDYNDLELLAFEAITKNPEWQNLLFAFDEHTDHILIDEFQDTSTLQWKIIDKLTEEWRSGMGAKRESGIRPTVFLVGDDKQSIYSFRGANVAIFSKARERLSEWLNDEYHFIEIEENYRSLPAIVNFVNSLFSRIMHEEMLDMPGTVRYSPFRAEREGEGEVVLSIIYSEGNVRDGRKKEAMLIARKINEVVESRDVYDRGVKRRARYSDIAILLRGRTHLAIFEDSLRRHNIPFVVIKGMGFYHSPEVAILRDLLFFLLDQRDDYSLFNILRSPLFGIDYEVLASIIMNRSVNGIGGMLFSQLQNLRENPEIVKATSLICNWIEKAKSIPYSILLEEILTETEGWQYFHEPQRYNNIKKFIRLIEDDESRGMTGLEIREKLIRAFDHSEEPKANVNSEEMNAVRILTIHAAKGLQFPVVFLPCLDEDSTSLSKSIIMEDDGERIILGFEDDSDEKKKSPLFMRASEKVKEEEKRLFYVAVTRAMDHLYMTGLRKDEKIKGKLLYIAKAFDLELSSESFYEEIPLKIEIIKEVPSISHPAITRHAIMPDIRNEDASIIYVEPLDYTAPAVWTNVTEEIEYIRKKHGDNWVVLGRIFHSLFEGISRSIITLENLDQRLDEIIRKETISPDSRRTMKDIVEKDIMRLIDHGLLEKIVMPRDNSFAELPFILQKGNKVYKGRIDRIIIDEDIARIYDYKTYPVSEKEIPELIEKYSFQLQLYREATERIFSLRTEAYLFFTHELKIVSC
jgi:ATP-dependent helicase/nuclease subunit A